MTLSGRSWLALLLTAGLVSLAGGAGQLAFALVVGLGLGLLHGASDLCLVSPARRPVFLGCYLATALACLLCWQLAGALALALFLLLSAWHFAHEDELFAGWLTSLALGLFILGGPALLHPAAVARLLALAMGPTASLALAQWLTWLLVLGGALSLPVLLLAAWQRRCPWLAVTLFAVVLAPPLVGFALGFYLLHAAPQTRVRQRLLGAASLKAYLWLTWPILLGAAVFTLAGGLVFLLQERTGIRALFAVLAAFAVPHMLVLPRFLETGATAQPRLGPQVVER
ncbi:beta-carotene 15,15'-dioxygenase, Brp/Blh family [Pseudomonas oryzihabitans]|uniref:beta-carotene 15,15'-dioxygenase, Brp/Blh family n=1 Tax=Pseudomonas oryzihabitans TaxID=47885 RepID=UPI002856A7D5|nr:beta-carotene 15,15'-dioxygenase, Brp/Blh family [Pseudomonas psychrotolerans]MDR6678194.1 Brp/Blh family beta-carotene 15,15'-monooxygenase [Pseudomonas psychrotolerans]